MKQATEGPLDHRILFKDMVDVQHRYYQLVGLGLVDQLLDEPSLVLEGHADHHAGLSVAELLDRTSRLGQLLAMFFMEADCADISWVDGQTISAGLLSILEAWCEDRAITPPFLPGEAE